MRLVFLGTVVGRESRVYAVPPWTDVVPLAFEDHPFRTEDMADRQCARCGSANTYLDEIVLAGGRKVYTCSDTAFCERRRASGTVGETA